jgi:DNA polymerase III epsilon subunit-like protein
MRVQHRVLVIDVETTGFDPARHACIEIGAVSLDESLHPVQEFSSLIAPWEGAQIVEQAMNVNKISQEQLQSAPHVDEVVKKFHDAFRLDEVAPLIAGWNVWFDVSFLKDLYQRTQRAWPFSYRLLDVQSVVSFHSMLAGLSQEKAIEGFLNERQAHRALADARHTSRLLRLMAERYSGDLVNGPRHV